MMSRNHSPETPSAFIQPAQHPPQTGTTNEDGAYAYDVDSAISVGNLESSRMSITSSILRYRTLHGRTYHSEQGNTQYWGSNDDAQAESMDILHHVFTLTLNGALHMAPLEGKDTMRVLDIGTGTGIWAIDFADLHPESEVIGTDISPIQPYWVPSNLRFEIEDCTQPWTWEPGSFSFIHMRYLLGSIPDWNELMRQCYATLRPGGWVESFESSPYFRSDDDTIPEDSAVAQWGKIFVAGGKKTGLAFEVVDQGLQRKAMEEAGFVDICERPNKTPIGGWPADKNLREIGQYSQAALEQDCEGFILYMTHLQGWSHEEVQDYIDRFNSETRSNRLHAYFLTCSVWGRKPE